MVHGSSLSLICINYTKEFGTTRLLLCDYFINCFVVVIFTLYCLVKVAWVDAYSDFGDFSFVISCFREDNTVIQSGSLLTGNSKPSSTMVLTSVLKM